MRVPQDPPSTQILLQRTLTRPQRLMELVAMRSEDLPQHEEYLHWDKLRHLSPPAGLSHEEWWWLVKRGRQSGRQGIPLRDKKGVSFSFSLVPEMFEALHHIDQRCAGNIAMPEQVTDGRTRDRYQINSLMEEAVTSSLLEGAAVTRQKARDMLRSGRKPTDKSERMIVNNFKTMQHLLNIKDRPLTPELVFEIHAMISEDALDKPDGAGRLRRADEYIEVSDDLDNIFHIPPAASQLPGRLEEMCFFANETGVNGFLHPVIRSIALHFWLAYDHPFVDGNGRTARALFYWSMLRGGYWLFQFISISQALLRSPSDYYRAFLHTKHDENDLNYFILHQLRCIETSIQDLHEYLARKSEQRRGLQIILRGLDWVNHRQQALLSHALEHDDAAYTFESHQRSHRISRMTAISDLRSLEEKGLLVSRLQGRQRVFRPIPNLETKLGTRTRP